MTNIILSVSVMQVTFISRKSGDGRREMEDGEWKLEVG